MYSVRHMTGTTFNLKPCPIRSTRMGRSSQLIWVDPSVLMYIVHIKFAIWYISQ